MRHIKVITAIVAIALLFNFSACEKEGPAGPIGPQGEQGTAGEQGLKGDKGDKGDTGTANVVYSEWLGADFEAGIGAYNAVFTAPELTEGILDHGEVVVYMRQDAGSAFTYKKLNYTLTVAGTTVFILFSPSVGGLTVSASFEADAPDYGFRYVIIPGGLAASARADGIDLGNYKEVEETFNIPN